jgi:bla regulator protein BlaR1
VVLLRLLLPVAPASPWSLYRLPGLELPVALSVPISQGQLLWWIWAAGAATVATRLLYEERRLAWAIVRRRPVTDSRVLDLLEDCKAAMRIYTPLAVIETPQVSCPALHGLFRPRLLLPPGLLKDLSAADLRCVFLHELAHLRRHDIAVGWLMAWLQAVHWFNPLVWIAFHRLRADRELAADEVVLWLLGRRENRSYGEAILRLLHQGSTPGPDPALVGILEDQRQMERRLRHIARFDQLRRWPVVSLVLFGLVALAGLTDSPSSGLPSNEPGRTTSSLP